MTNSPALLSGRRQNRLVMSLPEFPAQTDPEKILAALENQAIKIDHLTDAINGLGENLQWLINQAQGIFQVFSSPQFMSQILSGAVNAGSGPAEPSAGPAEDGRDSGSLLENP